MPHLAVTTVPTHAGLIVQGPVKIAVFTIVGVRVMAHVRAHALIRAAVIVIRFVPATALLHVQKTVQHPVQEIAQAHARFHAMGPAAMYVQIPVWPHAQTTVKEPAPIHV